MKLSNSHPTVNGSHQESAASPEAGTASYFTYARRFGEEDRSRSHRLCQLLLGDPSTAARGSEKNLMTSSPSKQAGPLCPGSVMSNVACKSPQRPKQSQGFELGRSQPSSPPSLKNLLLSPSRMQEGGSRDAFQHPKIK